MLIFVNEIPPKGINYDMNVQVELDQKFLEPAHFTGTISKIGVDVRLAGSLKAAIEVECDRCLQPFSIKIDSDIELIYRPLPQDLPPDHEFPAHELGILYYENNAIDLSEIARDTIIIEMPMKLLCKEDCKGLCAQCGQNLNSGSCECSTRQSTRNPFQEFFEKRNKR